MKIERTVPPKVLLILALSGNPACHRRDSSSRPPEPSPRTEEPSLPSVPQLSPAPPAPSSPAVPLPKPRSTDFVWIGRVVGTHQLDCSSWDLPEAPRKRVPLPLHDATDYPDRLSVQVEVMEIFQDPLGAGRRGGEGVTLAFALGPEAFRPQKEGGSSETYSLEYCRKLKELLAAEYVTFFAYPIYVDRGNSLDRGPWHSLGTDPGLPNAVHSSLTEARDYLRSVLEK